MENGPGTCAISYLDARSAYLRGSMATRRGDEVTRGIQAYQTRHVLCPGENVLEHNRETTLPDVAFHGGRRAQFLVHDRRYLKCIPSRTSGSNRAYVSDVTGREKKGI